MKKFCFCIIILSIMLTIHISKQINATSSAKFLDTPYVLVNKNHTLNKDYVPPNLILMTNVVTFNPKYAQPLAANNYYLLYQDALKLNFHFIVYSAYRSYENQSAIYTGISEYIAKPGQSEHQTGLALDITVHGIGLHESLATYPEGKWLKENAHHYGFIIRYPKDKEHITGYKYEPWHIRYVGRDIASIIYQEQITFEEYIAKYKLNSN